MSQVISVDFSLQWGEPVFVRVLDGFRERINGPDDAIECLNRRWAIKRSERYVEAKRRCIGALCGQSSLTLARACFINAAADAGMLA